MMPDFWVTLYQQALTLLGDVFTTYRWELVGLTWQAILITAGAEVMARLSMAWLDVFIKDGPRRDKLSRAVGLTWNMLISFSRAMLLSDGHGWNYIFFWTTVYGGLAGGMHLFLEKRLFSKIFPKKRSP